MKINFSENCIYSQLDPRWSGEILGYNTPNSIYNIYNFGCLITCLAMICRYVGYDENPSTINSKLQDNNGFSSGGGLYMWGSIKRLFEKITEERVVVTPDPLSDIQVGEIKQAIDNGWPVILQIDYNPRTVSLDMHYVLAIGYNPNDENDLTIIDPLGGVEKSLKSYLGWWRPSIRKTIEQYAVYKCDVESDNDELEKMRESRDRWKVEANEKEKLLEKIRSLLT